MPTVIVGENSYVTPTEYDTYLDNVLGGNVSADQDTKDRSLITAFNKFQVIDWQGQKTDPMQTAAWPRTGVFCDGQEVDSSTVPDEIKTGQMALANLYITSAELITSPSGAGNTGLKRAQAGSAEVEFFSRNINVDIEAGLPLPSLVWDYVSCFAQSSEITAGLLGSGFSSDSTFEEIPYRLNRGYR